MRKLLAALLAGVLVLTAAAPAGTAAVADTTTTPLRIMTMGDSITRGDGTTAGAYRAELGRLLADAGVPYVFVVQAVGETTCDYWVPRATALVQQYTPDVVLLNCGTNNFPANATQGAAFEAIYRQLTLNIAAGSPTVRVISSFVQYSAVGGYPYAAKAWAGLTTSEPIVNDAIWRAVNSLFSYRIWGWADMQQIPEAYLDEGGVHPTASGYAVMGRIWYDAIRINGLIVLPDIVVMPCGMSGRRPGWGSPPYEPIRPGCPVV